MVLEELSRRNVEGDEHDFVLQSFVQDPMSQSMLQSVRDLDRSVASSNRGRSIPPKGMSMSLVGVSQPNVGMSASGLKQRKKST